MKLLRTTLTGITLIALILASVYLYLIYKNNTDSSYPTQDRINTSLNKSINWVLSNQNELLKINNPILWYFIYESAKQINNKPLLLLTEKYRTTSLGRESPWNIYFNRDINFIYLPGSLNELPEYNILFIYGLSCNNELAEEEVIQRQLNIDYCGWRPYYSPCITHQLMGIRFMQTSYCGDEKHLHSLTDQLAHKIEQQLKLDPRVGDVYAQRLLMLQEAGYGNLIKATWISRLLNEQLDDGSWASFDSLFPVSNTHYFGFNYKFVDIREPKGNLHTTAQAIYFLSLLSTKH